METQSLGELLETLLGVKAEVSGVGVVLRNGKVVYDAPEPAQTPEPCEAHTEKDNP